MTGFILDNSVTMRWCFQNTTHAYADGILQRLAFEKAFVPVLWCYEVSAVLAKAQKDNVISNAKSDAFRTQLSSLDIHVDFVGVTRVLNDVHRIALAQRLTSYDAAYLELAIRKGLPLATLDDELIRSCRAIGHPLL